MKYNFTWIKELFFRLENYELSQKGHFKSDSILNVDRDIDEDV